MSDSDIEPKYGMLFDAAVNVLRKNAHVEVVYMLKRIVIASAIFFAVGASVTYGQTASPASARNSCSLLAGLEAEFRKRNPNIGRVRIIDMRPTLTGTPKYLVLGWGIRADRTFRGNFEDELFGLFLVDDSLSSVEKVLDFIPTPRWHDTEMRIKRVDADKAVLEAKGETYGIVSLRRNYDLRKEGRIPRRP